MTSHTIIEHRADKTNPANSTPQNGNANSTAQASNAKFDDTAADLRTRRIATKTVDISW